MEQRRWLLFGTLLAAWLAAGGRASGEERLRLGVPPGFVVQRAALPDAVRFPMFAALDDRGRLFVAESSGLDLYAEIAAGTRQCRVSVLEDRDGDGVFEAARVFADGLVFPMGVAWRDGRLYVADPPDVIALEDADGDGRADRRAVILTGFGHTDNGSLHGLTFGPDGLLYMTMGTPDGYRLPLSDGSRLEGKSGALLRARPDGSQPEAVCRGFVNLVEVAFMPSGDAIGTDNWFSAPAGGFRDALVHLVAGGLYPYVPDEGTLQVVTGEPLPALARFPAVALSGLERYRGSAFPSEYHGNLFSAQHNARRVGRHVLFPEGSTYRSEDSDFLTTSDPDFHPSDLLEDADGSLLVLDTGAWYVQHCPTGSVRASSSRGGLYRVRWALAPRNDDPRGLALAWPALSAADLARLLSDPRPAVRDRAVRSLSGLGKAAIPPLGELLRASRAGAKVEAVWVLAAIADNDVLPLLRVVLADADVDVACAAARALARRAARSAESELMRRLRADHPRLRAAAAEALATCGSVRSLPAIWQALSERPDRFLAHALVYAAHRLADADALEAALGRADPLVQGAALLLLDQPPRPSARLEAAWVVVRASAPDAGLRRTALHVLSRHAEWSSQALDHIKRALRVTGATDEQLAPLEELIQAFQHHSDVKDLLAHAAADRTVPPERRAWVLAVMSASRLAPLPGSWIEALGRSLRDADPAVRRAAVQAAAVLQVALLDRALLALADERTAPPELRMEALRGALARHPEPSAAAFELLIRQLGATDRPLSRLAAGEIAGQTRLDDSRRLRLLAAVRGSALITPGALRTAFAPPLSAQAASAWFDYVEASLRSGWRPPKSELLSLLDAIPGVSADRRACLIQIAAEGMRERRARLAEFQPLLLGGEPQRGRDVFYGAKAACGSCHALGASGGRIGPDLTKIGAVRSGIDILESILWPSATLAQGYEPYSVATADGRIQSGLVAREDADVLVLRDQAGSETRLRRDDIQELRRSETSLMPAGLERQLTRDEFRDLLAFLMAQR
jgi:putative membrane-bound dehydrogenase-like protein